MNKRHFPELTAKERNEPSFPTKWLMRNKLLKGNVLDFGCGFGKDAEYLISNGYNVTNYDPFYFPALPVNTFDTIICHYVLNVLEPEQQTKVLLHVSELLKKGGKAYFAVRRDITHKNDGIRLHYKHQKPTYQCVVKLPYKSVYKNEHCEIYEYSQYRKLNSGDEACPFCNLDENTNIITESARAFAIYDKYPVSNGHILIVPKIHEKNYFMLDFHWHQGLLAVLNRSNEIIKRLYQPKGLNIGINIGHVAGQTVEHVHIHLIPRYENDVIEPTGGVRNIIPGKGNYLPG